LWDEIYSEIRSYFGYPDKSIEANNIIIELEGSGSFELLKKSAEEKNARTGERMRDLVERGEHPWQQPEFINAHSKRTGERMRDLVARGEHWFQQPEFIEKRKKEQEEQARQKKEQEDQGRHEALQRKKEHEEHGRQQMSEQEEQAPKARGKYKKFEDQMEDLKQFKETHGHANVSIHEDKSLGQVCNKTRHTHKNPGNGKQLTDERIAAFDALGFNWMSKEYVTRSFDERIEDLNEYKKTHGYVNVNRHEDSSLYEFIVGVRHSLKQFEKDGRRKLTKERIAGLDALGFEWIH
jgi:hypothetical protein